MMHSSQIESPVQSLEEAKIIPSYISTDLEICKKCNYHVQRLLSLQLEINEKSQLLGSPIQSCLRGQIFSEEAQHELKILLNLWKKMRTSHLRDACIYRFCSIALQNGIEQNMLPEDVLYSISPLNKAYFPQKYGAGTTLDKEDFESREFIDPEFYQKTIHQYTLLARKCQANFSFMVEELLKAEKP